MDNPIKRGNATLLNSIAHKLYSNLCPRQMELDTDSAAAAVTWLLETPNCTFWTWSWEKGCTALTLQPDGIMVQHLSREESHAVGLLFFHARSSVWPPR